MSLKRTDKLPFPDLEPASKKPKYQNQPIKLKLDTQFSTQSLEYTKPIITQYNALKRNPVFSPVLFYPSPAEIDYNSVLNNNIDWQKFDQTIEPFIHEQGKSSIEKNNRNITSSSSFFSSTNTFFKESSALTPSFLEKDKFDLDSLYYVLFPSPHK